jgi:hypothetical protein
VKACYIKTVWHLKCEYEKSSVHAPGPADIKKTALETRTVLDAEDET